MIKIRLQRVGRKNDPSYRIVVVEESRGPRTGNHIDSIGFYNPVVKQQSIDTAKAKHWLSVGAHASDTVHNLLVAAGAIEGKKRNALPKKTPIVAEGAAIETTPTPATAPTEAAAPVETASSQPVETPEPVVESSETPVDTAAEVAPAPEEATTA